MVQGELCPNPLNLSYLPPLNISISILKAVQAWVTKCMVLGAFCPPEIFNLPPLNVFIPILRVGWARGTGEGGRGHFGPT